MGVINRHARRAILRKLKVWEVNISLVSVGSAERPARTPARQIRKIAGCVQKFGFVLPILVDRQIGSSR